MFPHVQEVLAVIFGITSGLLTLMGLISIFISVNIQQNIDRCKNIIWELVSLPYKYQNKTMQSEEGYFSIIQEIHNNYVLYEQIINQSKKATRPVIIFAFITITIVSAVWSLTILGLQSSINPGLEFNFLLVTTVIGILVMLGYGVLLLSLSNVTKIADLPEPSQLVDVNSLHIGVPTLVLAAITNRVVLEKDPFGKGNLYLELSHELPFINFTISAEVEMKSNNRVKRNQLGIFFISERDLLLPLVKNLELTESNTIICDLIFSSDQGFVDVIFKAELSENSHRWNNTSNEIYNTDANGYLNTKGEYVDIGDSIFLYPKLYNQKINSLSSLSRQKKTRA